MRLPPDSLGQMLPSRKLTLIRYRHPVLDLRIFLWIWLGMRLCGRTRSVYGRFRCILGDCSASDSLASVLPVLRSMLTAACLRGRMQFFRLAAHGLLRARLSTANSDGVRRGRRRRLACRVCWPALRLVWLPTKRCNKIARGTLPKFNNIRLLLFTFNG